MKRLLQLSAVGLLTMSAACASLPGVSIVPRPEPAPETPRLPVPSICLQDPATPSMREPPALPPEAPPPLANAPRDAAWYRLAAVHFESRAQRAEITSSFASNVADDERRVREENAAASVSCADQLRAREANAPVG